MKFLLYALNFAPEMTGCGKYNSELVEWLTLQGYDVRIVTAPPYYPEWNVQYPYSSFHYQKEKFSHNEKIIRCPLYVPENVNGKTRLLHLTSFSITSFPALLSMTSWKPDIVFCIAPTLFIAPGALFLAKITGAKSWLHIQDFEIDAAFRLEMLKNTTLKKLAHVFENKVLQNFDIVSTISNKMMQTLLDKRVAETKSYFLPNWADIRNIYPLSSNIRSSSSFTKELGFSNNDIILLSSGTMGQKQGLKIIISAAKRLIRYPNIKFILCGEGPAKSQLIQMACELSNVSFLPLQPLNKLNDLFNLADIHLLPQKAEAADLVMPSKLTGMLASGRPIIATATNDSQIANVVKDCGLIVEPENIDMFVKAILELAENKNLRDKLGIKARNYAEKNLDKDRIMSRFESKIKCLVRR